MPSGAFTMIPTLLDKQTLQLINRKYLKYSPVAAEKDYFLTLSMKVLAESTLYDKLVFKGGTAIHHCYLEQSRFSEDLDFTSLDKDLKDSQVISIFKPFSFFEVKKAYTSKATIKIERLKYSGVLDQPNSLKFEIDFIQNVVLPPKQMKYVNVWGVDVAVNVMDIREILAEKLRAMSDRARYRDFYDFYLISEKYHLNMAETIDLVKQKEIRKPISKESILRNWEIASGQKNDEIDLIYYKRQDVFNNGEIIEKLLEDFNFAPIE